MFKIALYRHRRNENVALFIRLGDAFPLNLVEADWSSVPTFPSDGYHPWIGIRDRIVAAGYAMIESRVEIL